MLFKIAYSDAPMIGREIASVITEANVRTRRSKISRLSQSLSKMLGAKGKVKSLSVILESGEVSIGLQTDLAELCAAPSVTTMAVKGPVNIHNLAETITKSIFDGFKESSFRENFPPAFEDLQRYKGDVLNAVLRVLRSIPCRD